MQIPRPKPIVSFPLPDAREERLSNGIPLLAHNLGSQQFVRLELHFDGGRWFETEKLSARMTALLLREGSQSHPGEIFNETFDFYGATLTIHESFDGFRLILRCLTKHLQALLPYLLELLQEPHFNEEDRQEAIDRSIQGLKHARQKNGAMAFRTFSEHVFGADTPYGYNSNEQLYKDASLERVQQHFDRCLHAGACRIFLAGRFSDSHLQLIQKTFEQLPVRKIPQGADPLFPSLVFEQTRIDIPRPERRQTAIRIGRRLFHKRHPDFAAFYILSSLLGGYFGSRLMQNLREDKGYTYNVNSSVETFLHSGFFGIQTEVARDVKEAAVTEIYQEIQRLKEERVSEKELNMMRNYLLGELLTALDGVFNTATVTRDLYLNGLDNQFYQQMIETVKTVQAEELQSLAQRYWKTEELLCVVVG